ncbi:MAG: DegT/DnrJ/EryC1/StrS family aminotransferase [Acetatifactor sp.]
MKIPFFDLKRQYEEIGKETEAEVVKVMRSTAYIEGAVVKELEQKLSEYIGCRHVITCGNGTDALRIALQAVGVGQGDEVITSAFSFFATAEAIAQTGAKPVFADIDEKTLNISPSSIIQKLSEKTKAILPVHIFGVPADMDRINAIAAERNIPVIEDACQAIGAVYKGKKAGALGTLGCFSFYPTKNLGAFGDGGMITTDDDELADVCRSIKAHAAGKLGAKAYSCIYREELPELQDMEASENGLYDPCKYYNYFIGGNSRLDSIQAAVLTVKLPYLDEWNEKRFSTAQKYIDAFEKLPVKLPLIEDADCKSCVHQYALLTDKKEELMAFLANNGVGTGAFYPVPLHLQKAFKQYGYQKGDLPTVEKVCGETVCLPVFPELEQNEIEYIIEKVIDFFGGENGND